MCPADSRVGGKEVSAGVCKWEWPGKISPASGNNQVTMYFIWRSQVVIIRTFKRHNSYCSHFEETTSTLLLKKKKSFVTVFFHIAVVVVEKRKTEFPGSFRNRLLAEFYFSGEPCWQTTSLRIRHTFPMISV